MPGKLVWFLAGVCPLVDLSIGLPGYLHDMAGGFPRESDLRESKVQATVPFVA